MYTSTNIFWKDQFLSSYPFPIFEAKRWQYVGKLLFEYQDFNLLEIIAVAIWMMCKTCKWSSIIIWYSKISWLTREGHNFEGRWIFPHVYVVWCRYLNLNYFVYTTWSIIFQNWHLYASTLKLRISSFSQKF